MEATKERSLPELKAEMSKLQEEIQAIQVQLGNRNHVDTDGNRLSGEEYWHWRQQANYALSRKLKEYRQIKELVKEANQAHSREQERAQRARTPVDGAFQAPDDPDALLRALFGLTKLILFRHKLPLAPSENAILDIVGDYIASQLD